MCAEIVQRLPGQADIGRGRIRAGLGGGFSHGNHMGGRGERRVALQIDDHVWCDPHRIDGGEGAIGAGRDIRIGHDDLNAKVPAMAGDALVIGGHDTCGIIQFSGRARGHGGHTAHHGAAGNLHQRLAREPGGSIAGGDNDQGFHAGALTWLAAGWLPRPRAFVASGR